MLRLDSHSHINSDNTARIWDTETAECLGSLIGHSSRIWEVGSSKSGETVATASGDGTVKIWDMKHSKMQCLATLDSGSHVNSGDVYTLKYHPTGVKNKFRMGEMEERLVKY